MTADLPEMAGPVQSAGLSRTGSPAESPPAAAAESPPAAAAEVPPAAADKSPVPAAALPVVAVVGRPNVGKSSLVNRMVGARVTVVEEHPGVTRDRKSLTTEWNGRRFTLVDTGGWLAGRDGLDAQVSAQAERALAEADLVLLVLDAMVGITVEDEGAAAMVRKSKIPCILVANKVDSASRESDAWELAALGLGDPTMVSALHGRRAGDLLDEVVARLPPEPVAPLEETLAKDEPPAIAIVGRPNVGKSTLFNRLVGDERSVTHDLPGTTRDAIDTVVETEAGALRLIDTAGLRRKSRIGVGAEYYSLVRALQAIDRADVSLLVIDATQGVTHQDQRLAERIDAAGSPVVIVLNKWECLDAEQRAQVTVDVDDRLGFLEYAPALRISALSGLGVHRLLPAVSASIEAYRRRVPTGALNQVIAQAQRAQPAQGSRVLYAVQGATDPPTITLFTDHGLDPGYVRYLERRIREHFALGPTALKLRVRRKVSRSRPSERSR